MNRDVKVIALAPSGDRQAINFMEGLALLFIGLKLGGKLDDWTWIETLAPMWAPMMINWFVHLVRVTIFPLFQKDEEND